MTLPKDPAKHVDIGHDVTIIDFGTEHQQAVCITCDPQGLQRR